MNRVGYGITKNGTPAGIWPIPLEFAQQSLTVYKENDKLECTWAIVPVFAGDPVLSAPPT